MTRPGHRAPRPIARQLLDALLPVAVYALLGTTPLARAASTGDAPPPPGHERHAFTISSIVDLTNFGAGHTVGGALPSAEFKNTIATAYQDLQLFWGDIHGHTGFSDGYGLPDEYFVHSRYTNNLDFAAISDHAEHILRWETLFPPSPTDQGLWQITIDAVNNHYDPGHFVTLLGFEWTSPYGHRNAYFRDTTNVPSQPLPYTDYPTPTDLWAALAPYRTLTIPHHVMRPGVLIDLSFRNNQMDRLVEIHSKWGSSEWWRATYEPFKEYALHPKSRVLARGHSVMDMLTRGFKVGLIGGTDSHQGLAGSTVRDQPRGTRFDPAIDPLPTTLGEFLDLLTQGYTLDYREPPYGGNGAIMAVFSRDLTRENIFDGMYDRHAYASTGARALVYFVVTDTDDSTNSAIMGDEISIRGEPLLSVFIDGEYGSTVKEIHLIKNGAVVAAWAPNRRTMFAQFQDATFDGTPCYYLIKVLEKQSEAYNNDHDYKLIDGTFYPQLDEVLWSSPIWVHY